MKVWQITAQGEPQEVLRRTERDLTEPGPGEVQIKVSAAGLGLPDVLMCRGRYVFSPELPFTPGQEICGTVTAAGPDCRLAPGTTVLGVTAFYSGNGGYAEYCLAPEGALYAVPRNMTAVEAAGFSIPYHTAWVGLCRRGNLQPGERVMVLGAAGGSGSAAIALAKALGAEVLATASTELKRSYCRETGADYCFDPAAPDLAAQVMAATGGCGVDIVYDPVGGRLYGESLAYCANEARLLSVGFASGTWGQVEQEALVLKNCSAVGVYVGAYNHDQMLTGHEFLCELYESGQLKVPVSDVLGFDEIADGLTRLANREATGKLVAGF